MEDFSVNWLNLRTIWLREPEFIGSEPTARATWFCVLSHCCELENHGRIKGARSWKDRQWQQTCGVTLQEVDSAAPLLTWDGEDLIVWRYPTEKQTEVQHLREAGGKKTQRKARSARLNGALGGRPSSVNNPTTTQHETEQEPNKKPIEGEGEGELEIEEECTRAQVISETHGAENGNPRVIGTPVDPLPDEDCQTTELMTLAQAVAVGINQQIPADFSTFIYDDWHSRGGKDGAGVGATWGPYVSKRWRRDEGRWKDGSLKNSSSGNGKSKEDVRLAEEISRYKQR